MAAFTFIAAANGTADGAGTTLDASASLNVAAGDLLVGICGAVGGDTTYAIAKNSGSPANSFTFDAADKTAVFGDVTAQMAGGYELVAEADATATFRLTVGASRTERRFMVLQFRPTSGFEAVKDTSNDATGFDSTPNSGNITTADADEVAIGAIFSTLGGGTFANKNINGVAGTEPSGSPVGNLFGENLTVVYRILTATFAGGAMTSSSSAGDWGALLMAFKMVELPPSGTPAAGSRLCTDSAIGASARLGSG